MRLHDFKIKIFSEKFGRFPGQPEKRVYAHAEIRRQNNRQRFRCVFKQRALCVRMPGRAAHQWFACAKTGPANRIGRADVAEIHDHIASADFLRQVITLIEPGGNNHVRHFRCGGDRLAHPAFCADEENADGFHLQPTVSKASSVVRKRAAFTSVISHRGNRHSADIAPRQESAVFTGTGFGSMKRSLKIGNILECRSRALFTSPERNACTRAHTSAGNKFEATLTTPTAPTDRNGSVKESSPLKIVNASGKRARKSLTRSTLPLASLIETIFRQPTASRSTVSGPMSTPQRPGRL